MIDVGTLVACGVAPTQARQFAGMLAAEAAAVGVDTPKRQAAFVAQAMHESASLTRLEESLYYRDPARLVKLFDAFHGNVQLAGSYTRRPEALANFVYANRLGNGTPTSGDGWRFRGGGVFQLTGRYNYRVAGHACKRPYEERPELLRLPLDACRTAAWYWLAHDCNPAADMCDIDGVTRRINPAMAGKQERRDLYAACREAFHLPPL